MMNPFVFFVGLWFTIFLLSNDQCTEAAVNVNVSNIVYNYGASFTIDGVAYEEILDTGSSLIYTYNTSTSFDANSTTDVCLNLYVDGTLVQYQVQPKSAKCLSSSADIDVGGANAVVNYTQSQLLSLENPRLHDWTASEGLVGMSYCSGSSSSCNLGEESSFQELVANATDSGSSSLIFGLDFRDDPSAVEFSTAAAQVTGSPEKYLPGSATTQYQSSLQLGSVSPAFNSSLKWLQQVDETPTYHQFFLENFQFCGAYPLGNYSTNWQVLVDTGAACLTLPSEIYDSFEAWLDTSTIFTDLSKMPAFSFSLNIENGDTLYIPTSSLLINESAILTESGAPRVKIAVDNNGTQPLAMRLCVLRGDNVEWDDGDWVDPAPSIIIGSMALRGVYFAANYQNTSVGLANKLSKDYIDGLGDLNVVQGCSKVAQCEGDQSYTPSKNKCKDPSCDKYFFVVFNADSKQCEYDLGAVQAGLFFILLFALLEIVSYFVSQYSAWSLLHGRQAGAMSTIRRGGMSTMAVSITKLDPTTVLLGSWLTVAVDLIVTRVLKWGPTATPAHTPPQQPLMHRADGGGHRGGGGGGAGGARQGGRPAGNPAPERFI